MRFDILNIQYHPNGEAVAVLLQDEFGLGSFFVNLRQSDLPANWGDEDVRAAVQAVLETDPNGQFPKLAHQGHTVALVAPPAPPAEPPAPSQPSEGAP